MTISHFLIKQMAKKPKSIYREINSGRGVYSHFSTSPLKGPVGTTPAVSWLLPLERSTPCGFVYEKDNEQQYNLRKSNKKGFNSRMSNMTLHN